MTTPGSCAFAVNAAAEEKARDDWREEAIGRRVEFCEGAENEFLRSLWLATYSTVLARELANPLREALDCLALAAEEGDCAIENFFTYRGI